MVPAAAAGSVRRAACPVGWLLSALGPLAEGAAAAATKATAKELVEDATQASPTATSACVSRTQTAVAIGEGGELEGTWRVPRAGVASAKLARPEATKGLLLGPMALANRPGPLARRQQVLVAEVREADEAETAIAATEVMSVAVGPTRTGTLLPGGRVHRPKLGEAADEGRTRLGPRRPSD